MVYQAIIYHTLRIPHHCTAGFLSMLLSHAQDPFCIIISKLYGIIFPSLPTQLHQSQHFKRVCSSRILIQVAVALPQSGIIKSYQAKLKDFSNVECIAHADVMYFTETFLKPHQHVGSLTLSQSLSTMFRCDRAGGKGISRGSVMIACTPHMPAVPTSIQQYPPVSSTIHLWKW